MNPSLGSLYRRSLSTLSPLSPLSSFSLSSNATTLTSSSATIKVSSRNYVKFDSDVSSAPAPFTVRIPHIHCHVRRPTGKLASKAFRKAEQIPAFVHGLNKPNTTLAVDLARLNHLFNGGELYDDKKVLLLIHNNDDKLVETTVAHVKGLLNNHTEHVARVWFARISEPVANKIHVDLTGTKFQDVDYYTAGGMSDDHQAFVNARWRKARDDWWTGVEKKREMFDPDFKPKDRGPPAPKQARKKK